LFAALEFRAYSSRAKGMIYRVLMYGGTVQSLLKILL
jgi:hypothetical protein